MMEEEEVAELAEKASGAGTGITTLLLLTLSTTYSYSEFASE